MKKELTPQTTIAIVAVFAVLAVALGWWWMNRSPVIAENAGGPGGGTPAATGQTAPPANAPTGANGSQGNTPLKPDV
jgi:hypothetical protein